MRTLNVALLEWPDGPEAGGPRLLGRTSDPDLVAQVRKHLAAKRRRELARLESPVRPTRVESRDSGGDQ
jgi:hypothetical protein